MLRQKKEWGRRGRDRKREETKERRKEEGRRIPWKYR